MSLLLLPVAPLQAREWQETDVPAAAVRASHTLQGAAARATQARLATAEARLAERSTVHLRTGYTYLAPTFTLGRPPLSVPAVVNHNLALDVGWRQLISTFGQLESQVAATRVAEQVAAMQHQDLERRVEEEALLAFHSACLAQEVAGVAEATSRARIAALREASAQQRAGVVSRYDVLRARTLLAQAQQGCAEAARDMRVARLRLFELLGLESGSCETLSLKLDLPPPPPTEIATSIAAATDRRLEVMAAALAVEEARLRLRTAQMSRNARLEAASDYQRRNPTGVAQGEQWSAGLQLSVPLVDGGASRLASARAQATLDELSALHDEARRQARLELGSLLEDLLASYRDLETSQVALDSAREAARVSRLRYRNGLCTALETQDAEAAVSEAEGRQVRARRVYAMGWVRWRRASGLSPAAAPAPGSSAPRAGTPPSTSSPPSASNLTSAGPSVRTEHLDFPSSPALPRKQDLP